MAEFNKEHVLPRAFGGFRGALTLARPRRVRVCKTCNKRLGDELDIGLSRGSWEAVLRLQRGVIPLEEYKNLKYDRFKINLPQGHPRAPMLLRFVPGRDGKSLGTAPMAQVRLRMPDGTIHCVPERDISTKVPVLLEGGRPTGLDLFWWSEDRGAEERLRIAAEAVGLRPSNWREYPVDRSGEPEEIEAHFELSIDHVVGRAIAKIGFEYFVSAVGETYADLLDDRRLEGIRKTILGESEDWRLHVRPTDEPVLLQETKRLRMTQGHLLVLSWNTGASSDITVRVALFNEHVYDVLITNSPPEIWREIGQGHHYDVRTMEVKRLAQGRFIQPPPSLAR